MDENTNTTATTPPPAMAPAPVTDNAAELPATNGAMTGPGGDVPMTATVGAKEDSLGNFAFLADMTQDTIYLMGLSFLLGVLFTVFILLVFDFMRRNSADRPTI